MGTIARLQSWETEYAKELLSEVDAYGCARVIARKANELVHESAAVVYVLSGDDNWTPLAASGEVEVEAEVAGAAATLDAMYKADHTVVVAGTELVREQFAHLGVRRSVAGIVCIPLLSAGKFVGAIEAISFAAPFTPENLAALELVAHYGGIALARGVAVEGDRNSALQSISRLTQLYDIEKVFNSTLEMHDLLPTIASKVQDVLSVGAVNVWLIEEGDRIVLLGRSGNDPTVEDGTKQLPGEGIAADVSDTGVATIVAPEDERLSKRNAGQSEPAIVALMAAPIVSESAVVGVIEACNPLDGAEFSEDDLFFLENLAEAAARALRNASLLQSERKVQILETLVEVSKEITSTLNLDRVLQVIVNGPGAVIPYDRASIAIEQNGKLRLKAISGDPVVNNLDPQVKRLVEILKWTERLGQEIDVRQHGNVIERQRPEVEAKFAEYFAETGWRGFYAIPLQDDEGQVGILALEGTDSEFLAPTHIEMIKIIAAQATVAVRNAQLYRDVPFIGVLEPLIQKKKRFMRMDKRRRQILIAAVVAVVLIAAIFPIPMRVAGPATVSPARRRVVQPEIEGVVRQVFVREGQWVAQGAPLADLEDWDYRSQLAAAQAKYQTALSDMNRALATNDPSQAGVLRAQAQYWQSEVTRAGQRLERTHLRAPIFGWVTTPHVEDMQGRKLTAGEDFAQIEDSSNAEVNVALGEDELPLLSPHAPAVVKLDGFPAKRFHGDLTIVSPKAEMNSDGAVFYARLNVPNLSGSLRPGMQGRAKISAGWHPVAYVFFRHPALWMYSRLWSWFGW